MLYYFYKLNYSFLACFLRRVRPLMLFLHITSCIWNHSEASLGRRSKIVHHRDKSYDRSLVCAPARADIWDIAPNRCATTPCPATENRAWPRNSLLPWTRRCRRAPKSHTLDRASHRIASTLFPPRDRLLQPRLRRCAARKILAP